MKTKLVSLLLTVAMVTSATLIPTSAAAFEAEPDTSPTVEEETPVEDAGAAAPEKSPAPPTLITSPAPAAPAATVADASYFTYTVTGGKATITDVDTSISSNIIIPDTLGGYPVTSIGDYAFAYCYSLTSVTIPDSVTSIGSYAFRYCYKLIEVYNRSSLSIRAGSSSCGYVGYYAKNVYTPSSGESKLFTLDDFLFYNHNGSYLLMEYQGNDSDISLPDTVNGKGYAIYQYAFYDRDDLTSVTIGGSVTSIGEYAFEYCRSLMSVTIPDSVTSIGNAAFYYCRSLTSVTIPDSVTWIGDRAFSYCSSLTSVTIGNKVTWIGDRAFSSCSSLTSVTIPDSVTSIGESAFEYCSSLTSVTIGNKVTWIGEDAFEYCYKLIEVYNRSSLSITKGSDSYGYVGYYAKNVYTPSSGESKLFTFGDFLFYNDNGSYLLMEYQGNDTDISLPDTVNGKGYAIYEYAFYERDDLTSVTIGGSVTSIGYGAFKFCSSLTSVTIGNSVTGFGYEAFYGCYKLIEVYNRSSLSITAGSGSYGGVGDYAKNVYTPSAGESKLFTFGDFLFYNDNGSYLLVAYTGNDTDISLPDTVNGKGYEIYQCAFYRRSDLTSVIIPDSVTSIGYHRAFYDCSSLMSVTIGGSVTSIGNSAFYNCYSLTSVYITDLAAWCQISFGDYDANPLYYAHNLYLNGELVTDLVIPDSVTSIGNYAFYSCSSLTSVTIPDSVTSIGSYAFHYCSSLASITVAPGNTKYHSASNCLIETASKTLVLGCKNSVIPVDGSVTSIGDYAFYNCYRLTSVTIGNSVTSIGDWAFCNCSSLTSVTIGGSVTSIGEYAFRDCSSLALVTIKSAAIAPNLTSYSSCGNLVYYAQTVVIPATITTVGSYVTDKFTYVDAITMDVVAYKIYSKHSHAETSTVWTDATCTQPITCTLCGLTQGVALGHDMQDATCVLPSTCTRCDHTEGEALGHAWGEWHVTDEPTYVSDGVETRVCTRDASHTETRVKVHPALITEYACGASVTARLYPAAEEGKYTLHIFGTGEMANYTATTMPWYSYLTAITHVSVYDGVTSIGASAFRGATSLENVILPASVTVIGESAFRGCTALVSLSALENVTQIGKQAFYGCSALASITFGENATLASVGTYAFSGCDSLALLEVQSQAVLDGLAGYDAYGYLLSAVQTLVTPAALTAPDYVGATYQTVDTLTRDGADYTAYSHHSHAQDSTVWSNDTCTECGVTRGPALATGDINADGIVDIADIATVIDAASGTVLDPANYPGDPDVNADGVVDIADIAKVIDVAAGAAS